MRQNDTVRTVLGDVPKSKLGLILPHEHFHCSQLGVFTLPNTDEGRSLVYEEVTPENAKRIRQDPLQNLDNIFLRGGSLVEKELLEFVRAGGRTVVELTPIGACRNVHEVVRLSNLTGLNVVMGSGYYIEKVHPPEIAIKDEKWLANQIIKDIEEGIDGTTVCAGIIGEIGTSLPILTHERKVLSAAVIASAETGRAIVIHVQPPAWFGHEILDFLFEKGALPDRIVLAHMDSTIRQGLTYHREILSRGVSIMYDGFGTVWDFPTLGLKMPSDEQRVDAVVELVHAGFVNQLLLSHDVCTKVHLATYHGPGFVHLIRNIFPLLREKGLSESKITQITQKNPAYMLAVRKE